MDWNSTNLIGNVADHYKDVFRADRRWDVWQGFYNGWVDGRVDMLMLIRKTNPIAYEFHNHETGHCYVDYIPRDNQGEKEGYVKTPLYKI